MDGRLDSWRRLRLLDAGDDDLALRPATATLALSPLIRGRP